MAEIMSEQNLQNVQMPVRDENVEFNTDQLILPAPIVQRIEAIDQINVNIPGEIVISQQGELLKKYLELEGFTGDLLETYNNWVTKQLPKQIASRPMRLADGSVVYFTRIHWVRPQTSVNNIESEPLYPLMARNDGLTYAAQLYADLEWYKGEQLLGELSMVYLGQVPTMLGSVNCHLHGKTERERYEIGECPKDPLGYFIIKGTEKLVLIQEKLRMNRFFVFNADTKGNPVCKMTCYTIKGSTMVTLSRSEKNGIRLNLHFLGKDNTISVFQVFRLFGITDPNTMIQFVLQFVKPHWHKKIWLILNPSFIELMSVGDDVEDISEKRGSKSLGLEQRRQQIYSLIHDELFPQMNTEDPESININKINLLSLMIARYCENLAGLRPLDDRDNWGNKRLESAGRAMEQLFNNIWAKMMTQAEDSLTKAAAGSRDNSVSMATIKREMARIHSIMTDEFTSSFNSNNWGVKGYQMKQNITDNLKRDGILAVYSHLTRINTPTSRQAKQPNIRLVQMSQLGYIDSIETPEGEGCGLVKAKALTCYISIERDELIIREYINQYITPQSNESNMTVCIINGKFIGWCAGESMRDYLLNLRRTAAIYKDTVIVFDSNSQTSTLTDGNYIGSVLYVYTDAARPTRPLLIVDSDGELVIKKKNLWGADMNELLRQGAAEYIDAFEQEYTYIAQSINNLEQRRREIEEATFRVTQAENTLASLISVLPETAQQTELTQEQRNAVLTVVPTTTQIIVEEGYEPTEISTEDLTDQDLVDLYLSTVESAREDLSLSSNVLQNLTSRAVYSHCELDPNAILGVAASIIPLPDHNQAPRNVYQCSMGKQALGIYHSNFRLRFDTTVKMLAFPSRPLFETQMNRLLGLNDLPAGEMVIVAIMTYLGYNQEDSIIFNRASIERGLFKMVVYRTYKSVQKEEHNIVERFTKPQPRPDEPNDKYNHLDENGIARIGSVVKEGDVIIGKIRTNTLTKAVEYANTTVGIGEEGVVENVLVSTNAKERRVVRIKIRQVRDPQIGDKFASRYAQKGTTGIILPPEDMPYTKTGMKPDIIINPHCIPSRMTIAKLIEIVTSKVAALRGERVNATAFNNFNLDEFRRNLKQYGYNEFGNETMFSGFTGKAFPAQIFIGPCYYQALRHHVKDKVAMRSRGAIKAITHQPVGGRQRGGGLRFGEMERDALIAHGASSVIQERLCFSSDAYRTAFCKSCGTIAVARVIGEQRQHICRRCGDQGQDQFGVCTIPYAYKLLTNILAGAGIQMRFGLSTPDEAAQVEDTQESIILGQEAEDLPTETDDQE